jgi:hypothetical protein
MINSLQRRQHIAAITVVDRHAISLVVWLHGCGSAVSGRRGSTVGMSVVRDNAVLPVDISDVFGSAAVRHEIADEIRR